MSVIDTRSISYTQILNDLNNFIESAPDWERWKDFFESDPGQVIVQLLAGVDTHLSYQITLSLREGFLHTALRTSSKIGIAETLGYSVRRGRNRQYRLTVVPSATVSIPHLSIIGRVKNVDLVNIGTLDLIAGQPQQIIVAPGLLVQETYRYSTSNLGVARFLSESVSEDFVLTLNNVEVPVSSNIIDLINDKYVVLTNHLTSVDVFYLNEGNYKYSTGSELTLRFIQTSRIVYNDTDLSFDYGTITNIESYRPYEPIETNSSIEVTAPIYHETQNLIRGRSDYRKTFLLLDSNLSDTAEFDFSAAQVDLSYVKNDETLASPSQKQEYLTQLASYRPFGVQPPSGIHDPLRNVLPLLITINRLVSTLPATVELDVRAILEPFQRTFGTNLLFDDIENDIEQTLSYVKTARIKVNCPPWAAGPYIDRTFATANDPTMIYKANIINKTGSAQPAWDDTPGARTIDNRIVWECDTYICDAVAWEPDTVKTYGQRVVVGDCSVSFRCIGFVNKSGATEPDWPIESGGTIIDNEIQWMLLVQPEITPGTWQADTNYFPGDAVKGPGNLVAFVVNFVRESGPTEPTWPTEEFGEFDDGEIRWIAQGIDRDPFILADIWNMYHVLDISVTITN